MVFVFFLVSNLYAQKNVLEPIQPKACVGELTDLAQTFLDLNEELRGRFFDIARLRLNVSHDPSLKDVFQAKLNELKLGVLAKGYLATTFEDFLVEAVKYIEVEKDSLKQENNKKEKALKNTLYTAKIESIERKNGQTLGFFYFENPALFYHDRKEGYLDTDFGFKVLFETFGVPFSLEIKVLMIKIIQAPDIDDQKAYELMTAIEPKLTYGNLEDTLFFENLLKQTSLYDWAQITIPQIFVQMNPAATALGRKIKSILESNNQTQIEFVLRALKGPQATQYWTNQAMVRAFKEITDLMDEQGVLDLNQGVRAWLSKPIKNQGSIAAKARYLGLTLNERLYDELLALVPTSEQKEIEAAIDGFSVLRLLRQWVWPIPKKGIFFGTKLHDLNIKMVKELLPKLVLESFEYIQAPIPKEGITYTRGSPLGEYQRRENENQVNVTLTQPFRFGVTTLTYGFVKLLYILTGRANNIPALNHLPDSDEFITLNSPVGSMDYSEFVTIAKRFTKLIKKIDSKYPCKFELPSEDQYEFMIRGGTTTPFWFGSDYTIVSNRTSSRGIVIDKGASPFGVYFLGQVNEWQKSVKSKEYDFGPYGELNELEYYIRGGESAVPQSWKYRSAYREKTLPSNNSLYLGARLMGKCQE